MSIIYNIMDFPVYYLNAEKFNSKWIVKRTEFINNLISKGSSVEEANDSFIRCFKIESMWNFNKIIGYIRVIYNNNSGDLEFEVFKTTKKKFKYDKKFTMSFDRIAFTGITSNMHIYVGNKSNDEIIELINKKIDYLYTSYFSNNNYIDKTVFNNICKYIDFKKMISDFRK